MIRNNYDGTFSRNALDVGFGNAKFDLHLAQQVLKNESIRSIPYALVQRVSFLQRE